MLLKYRVHFLWLCQALFLLRVLGQILVVLKQVSWLPPNEQWLSGLLPYPELLLSQILILMLMTAINYAHTYEVGLLVVRRKTTQNVLLALSLVYATAMLVRVFVEVPWRVIPTSFHLILAFYIYLLSLGRLNSCNQARS